MKLLAAAALSLSLALVGCGESNVNKPDPNLFTQANTATTKVEGMTCSACEGAVCSAIQKLDGVAAVTADAKTGEVKIALKEGATLDLEAVKKAVTDGSAGEFKVTGDLKLPEPATPAQDPANNEPAPDDQAGIETDKPSVFVSYKVSGMDCAGCSSQIVKAVEQIDGVQKAQADHATGSVQVAFDDRFDDKKKTDEIKDLIAGLSDGKYTVSY